MAINFTVGTRFPFTEHKERINRYKENMQLFQGKHKDLFDRYNFNPNSSIYVSLNLAGIICKKSADMLLGEAVQVSAGKVDDSEEQRALDRITTENYLNITNYESALNNSIKGDSFYKVRWGQEYEGQLPPTVDKPKVMIENLAAETVYPEVSPFDKRKIRVFHVCVPVYFSDKDKWVLHVESHSAGLIKYHRYELSVSQTDTYGYATEWQIEKKLGATLEEATGVSMPLVIHVPNFSTDNWEGQDDLSEHKSLFDEINNRLTSIAGILDKHSDPAIAVPAGLLDTDDHGNVIFNVGREKVFEMLDKDDIVPKYITWNGQLQEAYSELDRLIDNLMVAAEIPPVALGKSDSGTSGATGLSIRLRMNPLLSKVNRKRQYYDKALKQVYVLAQELEKVASKEYSYETVIPVLKFSDGLPKDSMQEANMVQIRTGSKPTMSQKAAIMYLDGKTEEQAEAEIKRINAELKDKAETDPIKEPPEIPKETEVFEVNDSKDKDKSISPED